MFYLIVNDINFYKSGMLDWNVICSIIVFINFLIIEVWIMDFWFWLEFF